MKKVSIKKLVSSLFLLCSVVLNAQNSSVEINLKPNSGTNNQRNADISVSNNLETLNFNSSDIRCTATTATNGEMNYSFTWLGSDFDRDGDNDRLNFDLVVSGYVGSTYNYSGTDARASMTNLGSLSNTTLEYNNRNINGWGVSNGDVGPGETLRLQIKNLVISGVNADYQISFDGFRSADIYETNAGFAHAMILGQGNNLEKYETNSNKTFSFDAIETLLLTGAGSNVAGREWAITGVNFSFSVINSANPNYWNINDYSDFKTASTYGEAYPDQQKKLRQPSFNWNKIPRWLAVRNTRSYTDEQIEAMANVDIVMLEKANDAGFNTIEEGISDTAARIKDVNPDSTVLFYWNSVINYGGYEANNEYNQNKEDWSIKNNDGSLFLFKDLYYNYNYDDADLRKWWVDVPVKMAQDPNIDGVFYDKLSQVQFTEIYDDAGTPVNNYARMLQDSYNQMPEGKITLGNVVRNEWVAGNRDLMTVFDGSYLERWDLRNRSTTQTQADAMAVSIQLMREALAKGKIINMATHPSHNFLDEPGTDIYGETITADPPSDPDELLQYMKDNIHFPLAVFLIAAEEGAYFSYNLGVNAHPNSDDYWDTGFIDELNYYVGPPLGDPVRNGYLYTRSYENVNVRVNLETKETVLDWIDKTRTGPTTNPTPNPTPSTQDGTIVHITKRNATGFAIDGGNGGSNGQSITLSSENTSDEGQLWIEIDRGNGFYSYEKFGTNFSIDGGNDGAKNQNVYLWRTNATNQNQQWQKVAVGDGGFKLIKRNATGFAINGGSGGVEGRGINLWSSASTNQNLQWYITPVATNIRLEAEDFDSMSGIQTEVSTESGDNVGYINNGDWLRFNDVDLSGITNMDVRVSSRFTGGTIEVRTGSISGTLIGSVNVFNTGGNQNWRTLSTGISNASGTQDVYLIFTGGNGFLFNVNWIEFNNDSTLSSKEINTALETSDIIIYPNPVESITTIEGAANTTIHICNMNGKVVLTRGIVNETETLDLSALSSGMYYLQVLGLQKTSVIKLIKE